MLKVIEEKIITKNVLIEGYRIKVAIRSGNKDFIPLCIFNGLGANWELVLSTFRELDRDIEIIAFDIPGTGSSSTPILPYSIKKMAHVAQQLLIKLKYKKVNVLGISWGGALAQQFARLYPDNCKKLILVATSPGVIMIPAMPSVFFKMMTPLRFWSTRYMKNIAASIYGGEFRKNKALSAQLTKKMKPNSLWGYLAQLSAISRFTSLFWLKNIQQPVLIMAGDDDPIVPMANAKILASKIPNSTLHIIKEGGHLFLLAQPEKAMPIIGNFLNPINI